MSADHPAPPSLKHELRTPLNHIIGYCELLIEEAGDDDGGARQALVPDLERIHGAGRRLLTVINDLFDVTIPEPDRMDEAHFQHEFRTPLNQIIGYTELLREDAAGEGDEALLKDLAKIQDASEKLLGLVVGNFTVRRHRLDPAERLDESRPLNLLEKETGGNGARGLVDAVSPRLVGTILVTDDDEGNREMLARRLRRLGHTVDTAVDGKDALAKIGGTSYELLLLDIVMPEMNGYEVLEHLRDHPPSSNLPVIVLSASDEVDNITHAIELGAEDYLPKPFDPALLQARIDSSLEKKRLRDREAMYLRTIEGEKERSENLLRVILPEDVAAELQAEGEVRPRRLDNVAVLFADVAGFTQYCELHEPEKVHRDLQELVKQFEVLTVQHGMEKIKTIGDAFLAAAGLLKESEIPVLDCVRCGLAMIDAAEGLPAGWQIRVGVHCGPVVSGIVGRHKYQFDIWGDTVNTAARLQSESAPGVLCVTEETWRLIEPRCSGRSLGLRELKGKQPQELYQVEAVRS